MNSFSKFVVAAVLLSSFAGMAFSQTTPSSPADSNVAVDPVLAQKISMAKAYLAKDSFGYLFSFQYEGKYFEMLRTMSPTSGKAQFSSFSDPCFNSYLRTIFSVDESTGDLVADVQPKADFCAKLEYRFDVVTKKGKRTMFDPKTKLPTAEDSSYKFTLN